jgi:hypothetical protein
MNHTSHIRIVSQARPATANAQSIWSLLSLIQALQGIFSVFLGQSGQVIPLLGSLFGIAGAKST